MFKFTVFTPTYNRKFIIENLYESLLRQSYKDFEWLIVDDGSTDDTELLINKFISNENLNISYLKKKNGGKHTAINLGLEKAKGELFFIVDSDDILTDDSLEILNQNSNRLNDEIIGLVGMKAFKKTGESMVHTFSEPSIVASSIEFTYKLGYNEETAICVKTEIAKKYKFPEIEKEFFCLESLLWNRLSQNYKFYYFNQIIYKGDYLQDGLTSNYKQNLFNSYNTSAIYYRELLSHEIIPNDVKNHAVKSIISLSRQSKNRVFFILKFSGKSLIV
ncbi:glycosyltransferase family A protein [Moheibacter sediminis]|uniref:Glycosyltransferase involved in cell wall bisynthesis n=1 Tax=Moheibacter sediminis TaxID=1434700 RepID=A0A1W1YY77_9FLAO|nr:glycosyltransferase family A protein [Moheibacter sediminis]SMC41083.1 Glycosyltransferase involved in cell wall bisynthesis [Moheibacter sediminis]